MVHNVPYIISNLKASQNLFTLWLTNPFQLAGGLAGVNSWIITYPADVVKTRIQAQRLDQPQIYNNFFHGIECLVKGYKAEGGRFLWYGVVPTCVRAFPSNAAVFLVWQFFTDTFSWYKKYSLP